MAERTAYFLFEWFSCVVSFDIAVIHTDKQQQYEYGECLIRPGELALSYFKSAGSYWQCNSDSTRWQASRPASLSLSLRLSVHVRLTATTKTESRMGFSVYLSIRLEEQRSRVFAC